MTTEPGTYLSDMRPRFDPFVIDCGKIPAYSYQGSLRSELASHALAAAEAIAILEDMLVIREFEEMIVKLRSGAYDPIRDYNYRGPTHVSVGQEGTAAGACAALRIADNITSTHRGHGESLAKGTVALRAMDEAALRARVPDCRANSREELLEAALEQHVYRTIGELFGKDEGYCRGRGGSMHIADFSVGHLGANAIVGGGVPIATGAALASRYFADNGVVCCFAGDGAYANGVVLESLNFAAQAQFTNHYANGRAFGLPIVFLVCNNHYGMTGRADDEVSGVRRLAQRAAGFAENAMHAEVVNGMNVLAVRDAVLRAAKLCREGKGPVLIEADCYRYWGHSLSDPRNEYRTKEEEAAWKAIDAIEAYKKELIAAGVLDAAGIEAVTQARRRAQRARRQARRRGRRSRRQGRSRFMYTDTKSETVPAEFAKVETTRRRPEIEARQRRDHLQGRAARGAGRGNDARQSRRVLWRRRRRLRRRVQGDEGPARDLRPRARLQHADQRGLHLRHGGRGLDAGPAGRSSS